MSSHGDACPKGPGKIAQPAVSRDRELFPENLALIREDLLLVF